MQKILITGGAGFLGSWVTRVLEDLGYSPLLLLRPSTPLARLSGLSQIEIVQLKSNLWPDAIQQIKPTTMIAFDWSGVGNQDRNEPYQHENVDRIVHLADVAKSSGIRQYIGFGSQAEIGPVQHRISDEAPSNPTTEYGKAKNETRLGLTEVFSNTQVQFSWGRIFSTYGQSDSLNWFIPKMIETLKKHDTFEMTKGEQVWNYLHAYDLATAVVKIVENERALGIVNIANPNSEKLIEVAMTIAQKMNSRDRLKVGVIPYRHDQVMNLLPDVNKIMSTGWKPQISLENGLKQQIEWHTEVSSRLELPNNSYIELPKFGQFE